ncbi:MAG: CBS domain-containing protein, partial [Dehalococcoidia bacterium]
FDRALRLSVLPVRRIMIPRTDIVAVEAGATLHSVHEVLSQSGFTRLPVYDRTPDNMVGVIHAKDVSFRILAGAGGGTARSMMRPLATVPESMRCERLVAGLRRQRSELAVVVDEHGGVAGLVTLEDLLIEVLGGSEALHAGNGPAPADLDDGRVRLPGRMRVDEADEWLGVVWEGGSDTLSGLVTERLGHLPQPGEQLTISGVEVEVEQVEGSVITSLIVRPIDLALEAEDRA